MRSKKTLPCMILILVMILSLSCTIKKHDEEDRARAKTGSEIEIYFGNTGFDAKQYVADIWEEQVIPSIATKAVPFELLVPLIKYDLELANEQYGYRLGEEGTLFNFAIQGTVTVISVDRESRNGVLVFQPHDCVEDFEYVLQVGPVFKGTSIRDSLDFISLNDFENQVEFARFANELNFRVRDEVLANVQFEELIGEEVEIVAVFTHDPKNQVNLMTPVVFTPNATLDS